MKPIHFLTPNECQIIIDTNAWMAMAELKIDLFAELERYCDFPYKIEVLSGTIKELEKIVQEQPGKHKRNAKLALAILRAKKVPILEGDAGNNFDIGVDNLLVEHSRKGDLVLTQDVVLKKRLVRPYLTLRQKKYVVMVR